jgi:hypothetical protein
VARLCQGDTVKKDIFVELTVTILLVIATVVESIIPGTKKM